MIFQIDESTPYPTFPDPRSGDEDGLFAVGGDLSIDRLLLAYCHGIFPWYSFRDQPDILWYCPMQRFVIFPEEIHVSHSMRTLINKDQTATASMRRSTTSSHSAVNCASSRMEPGWATI